MGFESLLGNERLKENLISSLGRGHISHFYLISGPDGSGKHTLAKLLAAAILCGGTDVAALEEFMNTLLEEYTVAFGGSRNAMFRLKENWGLLHTRFEGVDKLWKRLRKTTDLSEYKSITAEIFHTLPLKQQEPHLG